MTNPAFENMERLHNRGGNWSETSSDNNKDDTLNSRTTRTAYMTDTPNDTLNSRRTRTDFTSDTHKKMDTHDKRK